jgi:predicted nucleic acid-binding protein
MLLLDTNVVSETTKPRPNPSVLDWLANQAGGDLFISVLTLAEIAHGIERLPQGEKRDRLRSWHAGLHQHAFAGRILDVTRPIALDWAHMEATAGRTLAVFDALIAATARVHNLAVVTRNERDFARLGVRIVNPWAP